MPEDVAGLPDNENTQKRDRHRRKQSPKWCGSEPGKVLMKVSDRKMVSEEPTETGETESRMEKKGKSNPKKRANNNP